MTDWTENDRAANLHPGASSSFQTETQSLLNVSPDHDFTDHLLQIVEHRDIVAEDYSTIASSPFQVIEDDDALLKIAFKSKSAAARFGDKASFHDLWVGNPEVLGKHFPSENDIFDRSAADAALLSHLAFYTGCNPVRMRRLYERSALVRPKWKEREDYRNSLIKKARNWCKTVYSGRGKPAEVSIELNDEMSDDQIVRSILEGELLGDLAYIPEPQSWVRCESNRWTNVDEDLLVGLLCSVLENIEFRSPASRRRLMTERRFKAILSLLKANLEIRRALVDWDADDDVLGTPSSVANLRSGETNPRTRNDFILKSTLVDPAPQGSIPHRFLAFLHQITGGDPEYVEFLQRLFGYAATGSTKEHKLFFLFGTGRNGKSTLLNLIFKILSREYAQPVEPGLFIKTRGDKQPFGMADIEGLRMIRDSEIASGKTFDEPMLKRVTGGDEIKARQIYQKSRNFIPKCKLFIDANNAPFLTDVDEGIKRRFCLLPFTTTISEKDADPDLFEKLMEEAPAILRWIIDGAVKWYADGLRIPDVVRSASKEYMETQDELKQFLKEVFVDDRNAWISHKELYQAFKIYTEQNGMFCVTGKSFTQQLMKRGYKKSREAGTGRSGFYGLKRKLPQAHLQLPH